MRSTLAWELQEGQARGDAQIRLGCGGSQVWVPSCAGINLECLGHREVVGDGGVARGREKNGKGPVSGRGALWGSGQLRCTS